MKIRIKGNSVRMRLSKSEVDHFGREGYLEERTEFPGNALTYVLRAGGAAEGLSADFADGSIIVSVPQAIASEWVTTDRVGFENSMDTGGGKQLFLLIEKDFKCIDNSTEDQSDNYDHPTLSCG